jgi:hypothetical protein
MPCLLRVLVGEQIDDTMKLQPVEDVASWESHPTENDQSLRSWKGRCANFGMCDLCELIDGH